MRTIAAPAAAVLGTRLALIQLVEMDLTLPLFVTTAAHDIDYGGNTYIGGRATAIDAIRDQGGEVQALSFQLSGVPADLLAIALAEPIQGKAVRVFTGILDADTHAILDVLQSWAGTLDVMSIAQGGQTAAITVSAEHRGIAFARPKGLRYTDGDQQALYPGDKSLEFVISQAQHADVWPAAAWFRR